MTDLWFPDCPPSALPAFVQDSQFDDFDAQSERLVGHDQDYMQLSPGAFSGRFCSTFFSPQLSVHIELANQSLEQSVGFASDVVSIGLVLSKQQDFLVNGQNMGAGQLMIASPGAALNMVSPVNGAFVAICVDKDLLMSQCPDEVTASYLVDGHSGIRVLNMPQIAGRLRQDVFAALENLLLGKVSPSSGLPSVGCALVHSITAHLALYNATVGLSLAETTSKSHELYLRAKQAIIARGASEEIDYPLLSRDLGYSVRSIQNAFARGSEVTPYEYIRIVRLNKARRELASGLAGGDSIGDLASRFGFWNWSRFSALYKSQFAELPSQTRRNALGAA